MAYGAGQSAFKNAFEIAPIALIGGSAGGVPGGMLNVFSLLQSLSLDASSDADLDSTFANFKPLPGGTLIENAYGTYPFANTNVAANARMKQPNTVSMLMMCPARGRGDYGTKAQTLGALQNTLEQHTSTGGYFSVATPALFYPVALLLKVADVSSGESAQAQYEWQWDFFCPLVTLGQAQGTQNAMMSLLSSGGATDGALSGVTPTIGSIPSVAGPDTIPATTGTVNALAGYGPTPGSLGFQIGGT